MSEFGFQMNDHHEHHARRVLPWLTFALALVTIGAVAVVLLSRGGSTADDYVGQGVGSVVVDIPAGASLTQIATTLVKADVIALARPFVDVATADERTISPGRYSLHTRMEPRAAFLLMLDPSSRSGSRLVIAEGTRLRAIVAKASEATGIPASEFRAALTRPEAIDLPAEAEGNPEGWLFPATYDLAPDTTATSLLRAMTARFQKASDSLDLLTRTKARGLTPEQVVTIASLLEAEVAPNDYAKVSRVISNRLAAGMKLQFDSTVNYALGTNILALSASDLEVDSPFNTYLVKGLPPGPISSPGEAALDAALSPAAGPWLYFVTTDPKARTTEFATTYDEFLALKRKYQGATQ